MEVTTYGLCLQTLVPMRREDNHRSEMVSQLLYGECFSIVEQRAGWLHIQSRHDSYRGWIDAKQATYIDHAEYERYSKTTAFCADFLSYVELGNGHRLPILLGSPLIELPNALYYGEEFLFKPLSDFAKLDTLREVAHVLLGAPYLWGGRSPMGIDCSGLMQLLFRMINVKLPRDAYQQAEEGRLIPIDEAQVGDLAFFKDGSNKIGHVGMVWDDGKILHASGCVRIDDLHRKGIFDGEHYTHTLAWVRRFL